MKTPDNRRELVARLKWPYALGVVMTLMVLGTAVSLAGFTLFRSVTHGSYLFVMGSAMAMTLIACIANILLVRGYIWAVKVFEVFLATALVLCVLALYQGAAPFMGLIIVLGATLTFCLLRSARYREMTETLADLRVWRLETANSTDTDFEGWRAKRRNGRVPPIR